MAGVSKCVMEDRMDGELPTFKDGRCLFSSVLKDPKASCDKTPTVGDGRRLCSCEGFIPHSYEHSTTGCHSQSVRVASQAFRRIGDQQTLNTLVSSSTITANENAIVEV